MGISRVFYGYFFYVSGVFAYDKWMLDECFKSVSNVQVISVDIFWDFKDVVLGGCFEWCFKDVSMFFQGCFKRAF